jgi:hypothetical protein
MLPAIAAFSCVALTGCEEIPSVPYRPDTPAAAISGGRPDDDHVSRLTTVGPVNAASEPKALVPGQAAGRARTARTNSPVQVPVETGDLETSRYLVFSPVRVYVDDQTETRSVTVYTEVTPRCLTWRVSLIKDGREYYHFISSSQRHLLLQAIPLQPLALEPNLPVPDRIIVTLVR